MIRAHWHPMASAQKNQIQKLPLNVRSMRYVTYRRVHFFLVFSIIAVVIAYIVKIFRTRITSRLPLVWPRGSAPHSSLQFFRPLCITHGKMFDSTDPNQKSKTFCRRVIGSIRGSDWQKISRLPQPCLPCDHLCNACPGNVQVHERLVETALLS